MKKRFATKPGTGDPAQPIVHEGGCLCEDIRYKTTAAPVRVTICHCTFCQKITGSAFLVEPIFDKQDVVFAGRAPRAYGHRSDSSHKRVAVNFCGRCGTPIYLELERSPDVYGLFGGSFDNPNWFDRNGYKLSPYFHAVGTRWRRAASREQNIHCTCS